jgi:hypothetical protein
MKLLWVSAVLSLGIALAPAAFAHNAEPYHEVPPTPAYTPQPPQWSGAQHAYDSGYGMESNGSADASIAQKTGHGALGLHERPNDLFAHH